MYITRLRLLGFKSFVEPTELVIEKGLTGVVGPNGCGKSNLLEALRWVMGETSYKSMRGSSMEDVIFSGTNTRPPRNIAEVTMFVDNSARTAPTEFNDHDVLEITRRIERDMGSAYRVNSKDTRARDIKILFEDAATGARSPALVRQGQISEIVNAKPEQRRRILEDAAGVAGLHSRRHDAELRLKAAEANLARVSDVLGQLTSQVESLKRQARQARRYKDLSGEIRKSEALLHHLAWVAAVGLVEREEAALRAALEAVAAATLVESGLVREELTAAEVLPALRDAEAAKAAALHRLVIERDNFEREALRQSDRQKELQLRVEQMTRDAAREDALTQEAAETLQRLTREKAQLDAASGAAKSFEEKAQAAVTAAEAAVKTIDQRLAGLQAAAAEARARRNSLNAQLAERRETKARVERQYTTLETQHREIAGRAPDAARLTALRQEGQVLLAEQTELDESLGEAEAHVLETSMALQKARDGAQTTRLSAERLSVEVETLFKLLKPQTDAVFPPIADSLTVEPGYETALGAALGDDLEAPIETESPIHWRQNDDHRADPSLPKDVEALSRYVQGPAELTRRLAQIGLVDANDGPRLMPQLKAGQCLVSKQGDLWRWDGFVSQAHGDSAAAMRLAQRNRLGGLGAELERLQTQSKARSAEEAAATSAHRDAEERIRQQRQRARDVQQKLADARSALSTQEAEARETHSKLASIDEARESAREALADAAERLTEVEMQLETLSDASPFEEQLELCQDDAADKRTAYAEARAALAVIDREHQDRVKRIADVGTEMTRWTERKQSAETQSEDLRARLDASMEELETLAELPEMIAEQREKLLSSVVAAEKARTADANALAEADLKFRAVQTDLRAAQATVATQRETKARAEARLEAARQRRADDGRKTRELLGVAPDECLAIAEHPADVQLPSMDDVETQVARLKAERERLGGVNLAADDDLVRITEQFDGVEKERLDVEQAIAKLRAGIGELNKEAKGRIAEAFNAVNGHFMHLFSVLFGGGEARLQMLENPDDPLEGGLEIIAKPPGKKPATLSLLSGGEQTLTALSLIFAVFLTNPSPICVLDEVDAPLDDANVDRFCTMMERMAEDTTTRFLVITHHPQTMARMNRLFGVTMAEKGVSQLVSVDLQLARSFVEQAA